MLRYRVGILLEVGWVWALLADVNHACNMQERKEDIEKYKE